MSEELAGHIGDLLVLHVELDGVVVVDGVDLAELHVVDTDAVVGEGLTMHIADRSAHLQELLILGNSLLEFTKIVEENACAVVTAALITRFTSSLACKRQYFVILETFLRGNSIVAVGVAHGETRVVAHEVLFKRRVLLHQSLLANNVFFTLRGIEVNGQLNSLCLVDTERQIAFFL